MRFPVNIMVQLSRTDATMDSDFTPEVALDLLSRADLSRKVRKAVFRASQDMSDVERAIIYWHWMRDSEDQISLDAIAVKFSITLCQLVEIKMNLETTLIALLWWAHPNG